MKTLAPLLLACVLLVGPGLRAAETPAPPLATAELADRVLNRGLAGIDLGLYPGSLLMHGMAELAANRADPELLNRTVGFLKKFATKEIKGRGSFISYEAGGSGAAFLRQRGPTMALDTQVSEAAKRMFAQQKRSGEGLLVPGWAVPEKDQIFIDIAFAVTPYLLYAGLAEKNEAYVDLAVFETLELFRILRDPKTGLLHQGRGFQGKNVISQDNWSRGNGWGAVGLAALVRDLPATHPRRKEVETLAKEFFLAVLRLQNKAGLWHQEMTDPTSFTETSGSGLLLYGLGVMIEHGVLERTHEASLIRGLSALPAYIAADGSVSHACIGCLCPLQGTKADYKGWLWAYNDPHAFGPLVLAYAQAERMGIREITPTLKPGCFASPEDAPGKLRTFVLRNPDGAQNIGWENDRIAFRVYGPTVRDRVGSGIDIWPKSVEFPIVEKWNRLAGAGQDYHTERGEGYDFYHVGRERGCGGSALWRDGRPYPAETYATYAITANASDHVEFTITSAPWDAAGLRVSETKTIRMVPGTNFFQVTHTVSGETPGQLTVGIGLTTFGQPALRKDPAAGVLASWEKIGVVEGSVGTAIIADPRQVAGFGESAKDRYLLVHVKSGEPFTYYVGAGWDGNPFFKDARSWDDLVRTVVTWTRLNEIYARKPAAL